MRYFTFKHQPGNKVLSEDECKEYVKRAKELNCALMQYEYGHEDQGMVTSNWNFIKNELKEGDILFLRGGHFIYAYGKIIKPRTPATVTLNMDDIISNKNHMVNGIDYRTDEYYGCIHFKDCPVFYEVLDDSGDYWGQRIDVDGWKYFCPDGIPCIALDYYIGRNVYNVLKELKPEKARDFIKQLKEKSMGQELQLLEENKNLILTGAPGTGKTFLARNMAVKLIFSKDNEELLSAEEKAAFKKQCCFVQFHPSYDYTDFVEGLRPTNNADSGSIGFELRDGIFKKFCKDAIAYSSSNEQNKTDFDEAWEKLINELIEKKEVSIPNLKGSSSQTYILSSKKSLKFKDISAGTLTKENIFNTYIGNKGRESNAFYNYMESIVKYLKGSHGLKEYSVNPEKEQEKFVFIIDEINRGEISKIFGELFFSIDPDYRGDKECGVQTQYANMLSDDDPFKDGFYVPENVYIIGTMNDIDRSVESFDFAMRRRFVWHEIKAEESAKNMKLPESTVEKMKALNSAISNIPGLHSSHHIGAAYFLNKKDKDAAELNYEDLWKLRLKPLLKEYLRGMPNSKEQLGKLHSAFENSYNGDPEE
jgi:5-methylcytosine-specific restriction enzyme B